MERRMQSFKAIEDNGTEHTIHVIRGFHEVAGELGQTKMAEDSLMEMRTEDGRFVQPVEGGFEIIEGTTTTWLTSTDPNAPS